MSSGGLIALGQNRIVLGEDPNTLLKNGGGSFLEAVIGGTTVGTDLGGIVEEGPTGSPYVSLEGTLRLHQVPTYSPADGAEFTIIAVPDGIVDPTSGAFEVPGPGWSSSWDLSYVKARFDRRTSTADVELSGDGPERVDRHQPFVQRLTVQNLGPEQAFDVLVTAEIPSRLWLFQERSTGDFCWGQRVIRCKLDELAPSASTTIRLRVVPLRTGIARTRASVTSLSSDTNDANDAVRIRTSIG